jgi:hypothetical protein
VSSGLEGGERPRATRRATPWPLAVAALGIAALIAMLLALAWHGGEPAPRSTTNEPVGVIDRLCATVGAVRANNRIEASRLFFDATDDRLRRLAERARESDQKLAARLTEFEDRVEANLESPQAALERDLLRLVAATRTALRTVGDPVPPPCPPDEER